MSIFSKIIRWFHWLMSARWLWTNVHISTLQHYRSLLLQQARYNDIKRLHRYEYQVFSQNGEDGIISEIFKRITMTNRTFIEIGVANGLENNTTLLLQLGWCGYWLEGNPKDIHFIQIHFKRVIETGILKVEQVFVDAENVMGTLSKLRAPYDVDLLSVDIDRNTYYVLESLLQQKMRPRVIVVEYSALYPPPVDWKVEYSPKRIWNRSSYSGASLTAYELLARNFGYDLVGCDLCGVNAFFVREDLVGNHFHFPYTAENHYEPLRDFLLHRVGPPRQFTDFD